MQSLVRYPITQEFQPSDDERPLGLPGEDSDSYVDSDDSDADITNSDLDSDSNFDSDLILIDIHQNQTKVPEMLELSDVLPHFSAGHIYETSGQDLCGFEIQEQDHDQHGHLYYPWICDNKL